MIGKTIASVSGMESATTSPARAPRLTKLTAMMMAIACQSDVVKSLIACSTTWGWSATRIGVMPRGSSAVTRCIACSMLRPSARMSPPSRMAMARPIAGLPLTRNKGCGGSAKPRRIVAMSRRRIMRPLATKLMLRRSSSDSKAPVTRSSRFSLPVWMVPAGLTTFCA